MAYLIIASAQDTIRVNNNAGITADYTTLQAAHNGATAGDVIYLENSPTSYGSCIFTKQLTVIGMGYFLGENDSTPVQKAGSTTDNITFNSGSENSVIMGVSMGTLNFNASNITVRRNKTGVVNLTSNVDVADCIIEQNYITGYMKDYATYSFSGFLISNNIIFNRISIGCITSSGTFRNNIINRYANGASTFYNSTIENNIFYEDTITATNSTINNNIFNRGEGTDGNDNVYGITMTDVFELTGSNDGQYQLKTGSPAIGAASDGGDCGAFGGTNPYEMSGVPPIPYIYHAIIPTSGSTSGGLNVQVKIRSND